VEKVAWYNPAIHGATPRIELPGRETDGHMATSELFWKLFAHTGSINAYLAYRQMHPTPTPT